MVDLIAVRYEKGTLGYFFPGDLVICKNSSVLVETNRGIQVGLTVTDRKNYSDKDVVDCSNKILRVMNENDIKQHEKNIQDAKIALIKAKSLVKKLQLDMRFIDAFYTFDRNQLVFSFVADNRVDFRELARSLAQVYRTRIELRQVGVRDKAKEIGGLGPCGRFLCCSTFLTDFDSVSINMAKNQYIALNPSKINGVCGRLLCCLKYEDSQYKEMKQGLPKIGQMVEVSGVRGRVNSINLFTKVMLIEQSNKTIVEVSLEDYNGSLK